MNKSLRFPALATLLLTAFALITAPSALAAEKPAKTKKKSGTYSTSSGKSGTIESTTTREKGKATRETSVTNQDGKPPR